MIRNLLITLIFAAISIVSATSQKIAIVDINNILENMAEYQTAQDELDRIAAEWRQEIAQEYDKIKSLYNKYQAEQVLLSENERSSREDEILELEQSVRELQKQKFGPEGELFEKRQELVAPVQEKVYLAIESYASELGYDIILDKSSATGILFASEEYDKTETLKRRLGIR